ncbi:MAG: cyclic pyranopterin monophosphate synthase MoaC [Deltaproteobacteria bacterium]|nr:cyclic pyranopterin monophosphate synthase MoaC [Deltaproteobacteria bacterium]
MKMVDVGSKEKTERVAIARGMLRMSTESLVRLRERKLEKGDALEAAKLAGVMAVKRTPDLIPLCHPIGISGAEVQLELGTDGVEIAATVRTVERTGVEMEALTAVCAAALTLYDMLKSGDRGMHLTDVRLTHKSGGKSGTFEQA